MKELQGVSRRLRATPGMADSALVCSAVKFRAAVSECSSADRHVVAPCQTIAGQKLGAGNPDRARRGVAVAARIGLMAAGVVGAMFWLVPKALFGIFGLTEPLVASIGQQLLRYLTVSGFFVTVALTYTGGLQGTGDTRSPLYISLVSQIAVPIGLCTMLQELRGLQAWDIWLAIVLGHATRAALSFWRFRQGE